MTPRVLTARAESARELIYRTLGVHRTVMTNLHPGLRRRRLGGPDDSRAQIQRQATFLRLLSITESFCGELLLSQTESLVRPTSHKVLLGIWDDAAVGATNTWLNQKDSYKTWLGVSVNFNSVNQLAEARNAIAHGLGTLTRRQRRNETRSVSRIRAAGIDVVGGQVILTEASLARAADTCRQTIVEVDLLVQDRPRSYR